MALDDSGISLSTSDPDNNNPLPVSSGMMEDIEDYCSSELLYGDRITSVLSASAHAFSPAAALTKGHGPRMPKPQTRTMNYVLLAGAVVAVFVGLSILSGKDWL